MLGAGNCYPVYLLLIQPTSYILVYCDTYRRVVQKDILDNDFSSSTINSILSEHHENHSKHHTTQETINIRMVIQLMCHKRAWQHIHSPFNRLTCSSTHNNSRYVTLLLPLLHNFTTPAIAIHDSTRSLTANISFDPMQNTIPLPYVHAKEISIRSLFQSNHQGPLSLRKYTVPRREN